MAAVRPEHEEQIGSTGRNADSFAGDVRMNLLRSSTGFAPSAEDRSLLGPLLGFDPASARLHVSGEASSAAAALDAEAFTIGRDVFFGAGKLDTRTPEGLALLAHELVHVGQQALGGPTARLFSKEGGDRMEQEAQRVAQQVLLALRGAPGLEVCRLERTYIFEDHDHDEAAAARLDRLSRVALTKAQSRVGALSIGVDLVLSELEISIEMEAGATTDAEIVEKWAEAIFDAAKRELDGLTPKTLPKPNQIVQTGVIQRKERRLGVSELADPSWKFLRFEGETRVYDDGEREEAPTDVVMTEPEPVGEKESFEEIRPPPLVVAAVEQLPVVSRNLFFAYPPTGTGDFWHVVAAAILHAGYGGADSRIVFGQDVYARTGEKAERQRLQLIANLRSFGIESLAENVPIEFEEERARGNREWVQAIVEGFSERHDPMDRIVDQKISTAVFMRYILQHGSNAIQYLRQQIAGRYTEEEATWVATQARGALEWVQSRRKKQQKLKGPPARLLLINRRVGHENAQHDTTDEQFETISQLAQDRRNNMIAAGVATGAYRKGDFDLFDAAPDAPESLDTDHKRRTALFWAVMTDLQRLGYVSGLAGGRSGSMDIAMLMGMRGYSWDSRRPDPKQHLRLVETYPLMDVGRFDPDKRQERGGGLHKGDLISWLQGHAVHPAYDEDSREDPQGREYYSQLEADEFMMYAIRSKTAPPWAPERPPEFPYRKVDLSALPLHPLTMWLLKSMGIPAPEHLVPRDKPSPRSPEKEPETMPESGIVGSLGSPLLQSSALDLMGTSFGISSTTRPVEEVAPYINPLLLDPRNRDMDRGFRASERQIAHEEGIAEHYLVGHAEGTRHECFLASILTHALKLSPGGSVPRESIDRIYQKLGNGVRDQEVDALGPSGRQVIELVERELSVTLNLGIVHVEDMLNPVAVRESPELPTDLIYLAPGHYIPVWRRAGRDEGEDAPVIRLHVERGEEPRREAPKREKRKIDEEEDPWDSSALNPRSEESSGPIPRQMMNRLFGMRKEAARLREQDDTEVIYRTIFRMGLKLHHAPLLRLVLSQFPEREVDREKFLAAYVFDPRPERQIQKYISLM